MPFLKTRTLLSFGLAIFLLGIGSPVICAPQSDPQTSPSAGVDLQVWLQDFKEHMRKVWEPTMREGERRYHEPLQAVLTLRIKRDGSLQTVVVAASSNQAVFDERCLKAVRTAAPFSSLPKSFDQEAVTINFSFSNALHEESVKNERQNATDGEWVKLMVDVCEEPSRVLERASQLLSERPRPIPAHKDYLSMLLRSSRTEGFEKMLDEVDRKYGSDRQIRLLRAAWLYRERRFDEAHAVLKALGEPKSESEQLNEGNSYQQLLGNLDYAAGYPKSAAYHWGRAAEKCESPKDCNKLQALTKAAGTEIGIPPDGADLRTPPDCESGGYGYPAGGRMQALYKRLGLPLE